MWHQNQLTERLNLQWPILQAPMGSITTPALAAAVSTAGAIGGLGMWGFSADDARRRIAGFRQLSAGCLNVNYPLWDHPGDLTNVGVPMRERIQALYDEYGLGSISSPQVSPGGVDAAHLAMLEEAKPEVMSFHFGLPNTEVVHRLKAIGTFIICSATTVAEAKTLEAEGVDAVIAQGIEAGGHRGTFLGADVNLQPGLFALLPQVVDAVSVPVIAAGGIADGRGVAAAFMLGASGVQLGTAFLRCTEANVSGTHRDMLADGDETGTVVTNVISGRPARAINNQLVAALSKPGAQPLPFPAQSDLIAPLDGTGEPMLSTVLAGQSVALTRQMPAADLVRTLTAETTTCLRSFEE